MTGKHNFVYDGLSWLRVSKDFTRQNVAWVQVSEKRRVYDGLNVVQERDGANERLAFYTRGLDMGGGIRGLLARSADGVNLFYHYDGRGNVGQLTNEGGELAARYTYDAFGVLIASSGAAASLNAYRFSTKEAIGSLVYYGFRFYSPSLGKWINRDPISEKGGVNVYRFSINNPINSTDSYGLYVVAVVVVIIVAWILVDQSAGNTPQTRCERVWFPREYTLSYNPAGQLAMTTGPNTYYGPLWERSYPEWQESVRIHEQVHRQQFADYGPFILPSSREIGGYLAEKEFIEGYLAGGNRTACNGQFDPAVLQDRLDAVNEELELLLPIPVTPGCPPTPFDMNGDCVNDDYTYGQNF